MWSPTFHPAEGRVFKRAPEWRGREHAPAFDRVRVFDDMFRPLKPLRLAEESV